MLSGLTKSGLSRRDLVRGGGLAAVTGFFQGGMAPAVAASSQLKLGKGIYESIGVRPVINCKGTYTIISGSLTLPEVKEAMDEASRHYVHLDELMDAVGRRLAELTGAEWGMVTAGCAAALTHSTSACLAGGDPEKLQRLPYLSGLKSEVIMPSYSRNVYDHAVRMLGVRIVEAENLEQFEAAFNGKTAMVLVLACPEDRGPFGLKPICDIARRKGVPVLVDAAAEILTIPNVHLERGASLVAYSGGKCLRGPQCAGVLLGRKDLVQAAWFHSAPHHAFGRSLKVGKEEIMGMLAAVEMWVKRDHDAEWKQWQSWLDHIAHSVQRVDGVSTEVLQPEGLSNHAPRLSIQWDAAKIGIAGTEVEKLLSEQEPRIMLGKSTGDFKEGGISTVTIMPYMMTPGDEKVVAESLYSVLSNPPKLDRPASPSGAPAQVGGQWEAHVDFFLGSADHAFFLEQQGSSLSGTHLGEILSGDLQGSVEGDQILFRSTHKYEGTHLTYEFRGHVEGGTMSGEVDLGEYGQAKWRAHRHKYGQPGGLVRPVKNV